MPAALKTLSRVRATSDARHLMRYLKSKAGVSPADLAKQEGISIKTVQESIRSMEQFESRNSEGQLQLHARDMVISVMPQAKETITGLLAATTIMRVKNKKTGLEEDVEVEDKTTRLEAMRVFNGMVTATQPKVPMTAVQVNQHNSNSATMSSAENNEERLRRLRAKQAEHNLLPPVVIGTPKNIDAGYDPDEDAEDDSYEDGGQEND